jgi:hypothetical protein
MKDIMEQSLKSRMEELKFIAFLAALLGLLLGLWCAFLLAVYDQAGPGFFFVPFETCEDWVLEFVIGLWKRNISKAFGKAGRDRRLRQEDENGGWR